MNLQSLRDYCRRQLDMDDEELPNGLLDSFIQEGFDRTIATEQRWPFYETQVSIERTDDTTNRVSIPDGIDPASVISVIDVEGKMRLTQISNDQAEAQLGGWYISGIPWYFSIWADQIELWPNPAGVRNLLIRGYRRSKSWMADGAGAVPDCDERLHIWLAHYAIALCYAQQEDEVLEGTYLQRWQVGMAGARSAICSPRHHRPLVLNGGLPVLTGPAGAVAWSNPPVSP